MRCFSPLICLFAVVAFSWLPQDARSQQTDTRGFRFSRNGDEEIIAATYYGSTGLRSGRLHELPRLEAVRIAYHTTLTSDDLAYLSTLKTVAEVEMGGNLGDESVIIEGGLPKLADMESLEWLFLCKHEMKDDDLEFVASLPRITYLEFVADTNPWSREGPIVTDRCAKYLSSATTLRDLCIYGGEFTDQFVAEITEGLPHLEHLELGSEELTDNSLRSLANRCAKLRWLDIGSRRFTDKGVEHLAQAKNLEMLWLRSNSLTADCVKSVAGLHRLRHLELTIPSIDDEGVRVLSRLPQLEILAMRRPALTDEQFAMFRNHPTLESAFINGGKLSKEGVLSVIRTLPKLEHLNLGPNNKSLQDAVARVLSREDVAQ